MTTELLNKVCNTTIGSLNQLRVEASDAIKDDIDRSIAEIRAVRDQGESNDAKRIIFTRVRDLIERLTQPRGSRSPATAENINLTNTVFGLDCFLETIETANRIGNFLEGLNGEKGI